MGDWVTSVRLGWAVDCQVAQGVELRPAALLSKMATMHADKPIVISSPEIMSGAPVFAGTRVPVRTLVEYLAAGDSIDDFLEGFPSVSRDQVIAFLDRAEELVCGGTPR